MSNFLQINQQKIKDFIFLNRSIGYYFFFHFVNWFLFLLVTSFFSYFHFKLNHSLSEIESWMFDRGWTFLILIKLASFIFVLKFIFLGRNEFDFLKDIILFKGRRINLILILAVLFQYFAFIVFGHPQHISINGFSIFNTILSMLGMLVFYLTDLFFVVYYLSSIEIFKNIHKVLVYGVLGLFFVKLNNFSFSILRYVDYFSGFHFIFLFLLILPKYKNFHHALFYLCSFMIPMGILFGEDPLWKNNFSMFVGYGYNSNIVRLYILSVVVGYLYHRKLILRGDRHGCQD